MLSRVIWIPSKAHSRLKKKNNVIPIEQSITYFLLENWKYSCKRRARKPERLKLRVYLVLPSCSFVSWEFFWSVPPSERCFKAGLKKPCCFFTTIRDPILFCSLRICRAVIFLPKLIISFRKSHKLQLAAHIINILIVCLKIISVYKQFQFSFSYCNFPDNNFPCLHPSETLKLTGEECGLLIIYLFDRPEQPTPGSFQKADFSAARMLGFSVLFVLLSMAA